MARSRHVAQHEARASRGGGASGGRRGRQLGGGRRQRGGGVDRVQPGDSASRGDGASRSRSDDATPALQRRSASERPRGGFQSGRDASIYQAMSEQAVDNETGADCNQLVDKIIVRDIETLGLG